MGQHLSRLAVVLAGAAAVAAVTSASARAAGAVSAFPAPGSQSASAHTQISLRGIAPAEVGRIVVTGTRSGHHAGVVGAHADRRGASFIPDRAFIPGERVTVRTSLPVLGAATGTYTLRIASHAGPSRAISRGAGARATASSLRSRRDLNPPRITISTRSAGTEPGSIFIAPKRLFGSRSTGEQAGPMILDDLGRPVWFKPVGGGEDVTDFRVQQYRGRPVLTWWQGHNMAGRGEGVGKILDSSYRGIKTIRAGNGFRLDLHEFLLTPEGTAIVTLYPIVNRDTRSVGGTRRGRVVDGVIQEIDLQRGRVLFEWHSLDDVPMSDSYVRAPRTRDLYDYFHVNSASLDTDGNILISARHTWAIYKLDRKTGKLLWRLGGKRSSFKMGAGTRFHWQHDAERRPDGTLSLFDNSSAPPMRKHSRAIELRVDERARTARLARVFVHPRGLLSATQGNFQSLPNGNSFVGWGSRSRFTEFSPTGQVLFDGAPSRGFDTYRAYRLPWTGRPVTPPSVIAQARPNGRVAVYASWNGATGVARWEVLAGASADTLQPVGGGAWTGLETALSVSTGASWFAVRAFDAAGNVLGTSRVERVAG